MRGKQSRSEVNLSKNTIGASGVYFVAAQLARLGYVASPTFGNTENVDILVSNESNTNFVGLQVKTKREASKKWMIGKKDEDRGNDNLFYVFVDLRNQDSLPDFHIAPSRDVADHIKKGYAEWIARPSRRGQPHRPMTMRTFHDPEDKYLGKWNLLESQLKA